MTSSVSMLAKFTSDAGPCITCSCAYGGWTYVGGRNGFVYRTKDGVSYEEFWRTRSPVVSSMHVFDDILLVGTSPDGRVLFHSFSTGFRCTFVITGDYAVSSIVDDGSVVYLSTSPSGMVLEFDGYVWKKIYESFTDISSLCVYSSALYAFSRNDTAVRVYSGGGWSFMMDGKSIFSIGSKALVSSSSAIPGNPRAEVGVSASSVCNGRMYFSGETSPVIYAYDGSSVEIVHRFHGSMVSSMDSVGNQLYIAVDDSLHLMQEVVYADS
jgi:hypothetical protein